jgi:hypothetical protein
MPILRISATLVVLAGLYLLWSGQVAAHELEAAGACAVLGTVSAALATWAMRPRFSFRTTDLATLAKAVARLPGASWRAAWGLAAAAILGRGGAMGRKPFVRGPAASERDRARRAITLIAECLTPDSYVVRFHPGRPEIDLHELPARKGKGS